MARRNTLIAVGAALPACCRTVVPPGIASLTWHCLDRLARRRAGIARQLAATSPIAVAFALLLATTASGDTVPGSQVTAVGADSKNLLLNPHRRRSAELSAQQDGLPAEGMQGPSLIGDSVALNVTIFDPPDTEVFDGSATIADGPVEFEFDDIALDIEDTAKYDWDVDFLGPDGRTITITATRNTMINDSNGHFRSFEFTGLDFAGNAVVTGLSGTDAVKWAGGAKVTAVGANFFTFETGNWNSAGVVFGDTITATIELIRPQLQIVAHEDDDLYFMSPAVSKGIQRGAPSWTVFLTAGESATLTDCYLGNDGYWQNRENAMKAAYAQMAGLPTEPDDWLLYPLPQFSRPLTAFQHPEAPQIVLVFLRLRNGQPDLQELWDEVVTSIDPIDGAMSYDKTQLLELLKSIIQDRNPEVLRIQDMTDYHGDDHTDHVHSGRFAFQAHLESGLSHRLRAYRAYNIRTGAMNLSSEEHSDNDDLIELYDDIAPSIGCDVKFDVTCLCVRCVCELKPSGEHEWLEREYPLADVSSGHASIVREGTNLCLTANGSGNSLDFQPCADLPQQAFFLTERDIRHGQNCVSSTQPELELAPCDVSSLEQWWTFFTDGHIRGTDGRCLNKSTTDTLVFEDCPTTQNQTAAPRIFQLRARPASAAGNGTDFSQADFGTDLARYGSLVYGDLDGDGDDDACIRRDVGLHCALAAGDGTFAAATPWDADATPLFAGDVGDAGWGEPSWGSTIQLGDIDGDGRDDVCGRVGVCTPPGACNAHPNNVPGIYCARSTGAGFTGYENWTTFFADTDPGSDQSRSYASLRLGDVSGDGRADLCGYRNTDQFHCLVSDGMQFLPPTSWIAASDWEDRLGLTAYASGKTVMLGDIDGDGAADLCEWSMAVFPPFESGVVCAIANPGEKAFEHPAHRSNYEYSTAKSWHTQDYYWGTLRLGDLTGDGQADLCGRGKDGVICQFSMDGRFSHPFHLMSSDFSDAAGFANDILATTIQLADIDGSGQADVCIADTDRLRCALTPVPEVGGPLAMLVGVFALAGLGSLRARSRKFQPPVASTPMHSRKRNRT
jgi:LmbE family N-acetylglucosaminyl deacetylase